ncbi:MAG TPA: hypothetical protein VD902_06660 [Symbiobacteriaceae bacterium]|nr:hypothetical protein [Symbiobacteriaceae bacterium]
MDETCLPQWQQVIGRPPEGLHIIIDEQVGEGRGGLRSLVLLRALGCRNFTFLRTWQATYEPVDYNYVLLRPESGVEELLSRGHLVQILTQETEWYSPHGFTADLLFTTLSAPRPHPLMVLVLDTQSFHLKGTTDGKSLIENFGLRQRGVGIYHYADLYYRYRQLALPGNELSDGLTKNLWFHRLAAELKAGGWTRFGRLTDLLRFTDRDYPLTPTMRHLLDYYLGDPDRISLLEAEGPEYVRKQMKPWMEEGEVLAVARTVWWGCNVIDYDLRRITERSGPA